MLGSTTLALKPGCAGLCVGRDSVLHFMSFYFWCCLEPLPGTVFLSPFSGTQWQLWLGEGGRPLWPCAPCLGPSALAVVWEGSGAGLLRPWAAVRDSEAV